MKPADTADGACAEHSISDNLRVTSIFLMHSQLIPFSKAKSCNAKPDIHAMRQLCLCQEILQGLHAQARWQQRAAWQDVHIRYQTKVQRRGSFGRRREPGAADGVSSSCTEYGDPIKAPIDEGPLLHSV